MPVLESPSTKGAEGDADNERIQRQARRWRFYSARLAEMLGVSIEEMEQEIDKAIERVEAGSSPWIQ